MKSFIIILAFVLANNAWATGTTTLKQADNIQNSTGGVSIAVPSVGTTFSTDTNTITLQNKTISGASNTLSNIPASAVSSGQLGVSNGGTGASTLPSNGVVIGAGTSAVTTVTGSQFQSLTYGSGGVPAAGAVNLGQSAAVSGQLTVPNGGTGLATITSGGIMVGAGTGSPTAVTCSSSGFVLSWNGTACTCVAPPSSMPALNGSQASPQSVTAAGGISLTGISYNNLAFVVSNSGAVTVTATPSITACTAAGQALTIIGESASNTLLLQDKSGLSGSALALNGNYTSGLNSILNLVCDGNGIWVETSRQ